MPRYPTNSIDTGRTHLRVLIIRFSSDWSAHTCKARYRIVIKTQTICWWAFGGVFIVPHLHLWQDMFPTSSNSFPIFSSTASATSSDDVTAALLLLHLHSQLATNRATTGLLISRQLPEASGGDIRSSVVTSKR